MDLLIPVSHSYRRPVQDETLPSISETSQVPQARRKPQVDFQTKSPEEALEVLKNQPSHDTLLSILACLRKAAEGVRPFDICTPGPLSAQIVHALVREIVPNYWTTLKDASADPKDRSLQALLACLQSLTGINALVAFVRALLQEAKAGPKNLKSSHVVYNLGYALECLQSVLQGDLRVAQLWGSIRSLQSPSQVRPLRQELISLLTSGKIISISAEAEDMCQQASRLDSPVWIADGKKYVDWLGRNLISCVRSASDEDEIAFCAYILARAMKLGYSENLIKLLFTDLLLKPEDGPAIFRRLTDRLAFLEQRRVLEVILKLLAVQYLNPIDTSSQTEDYPVIWAAAGATRAIIGDKDTQKNHLLAWLTSASGAGIGDGCGIRRAVVAVLAKDKETLFTLLDKSLNQFGDQLYIRHAPMLQQEAHAQVLLLSAGYVDRLAPIKLSIALRSSPYLNAVSNRLEASQSRARFLGMVVGEALSGLVHGKETKLDFKMEEMDTDEASWYKSLSQVADDVGPLDPLRVLTAPSRVQTAPTPRVPPLKKTSNRPAKPPQKSSGFIIEEVEDDEPDGEEDEDEDLIPYEKPDSDAEDSDDDPTLINRDKPKAPVYIRDLISYLRDTENYDKQKIALKAAPVLIRRKANYGTEVISHAEELATLLVGLQDKYDLEDFHDQRLQGMIAIVVAQPRKMGQWFARTFFDGDYSLSQRTSILIVLGLSGREIAGFDTSDYASAAQFPSKKLPEKIEKYYALPSPSHSRQLPAASGSNLKALPPNALDSLTQSLSRAFLAPLAAEAADAATGPDVLKLSSFTSRLQSSSSSSTSTNDNKTRSLSKRPTGVRSIPNTTASLISTSFFFPLTSLFQAATRSSASRSRGLLFQPHLLSLYLKTLALLLHASGPSTLSLPQMTSEFWDLLLSVRARCPGRLDVTRAVLFGLATLLDVNERDMRGLCERHGRETVESVEWVGAVFANTRGGGGGGGGEGDGGEGAGEENEVRMLAAGLLIRLREAVEKYQALLVGDMIGFT